MRIDSHCARHRWIFYGALALRSLARLTAIFPQSLNFARERHLLLKTQHLAALLLFVNVSTTSACAAPPQKSLYVKGYLSAKHGNHPQAIKYFSDLIALRPNCSEAYAARALSYRRLGKFEQAKTDLNKAISINSRDANLFCDRGVINYITGKNDKALDDFNTAVRLDGKNPRARNWRANIRSGRQQFGDALTDCNAGIASDPSFALLYRTRSEVLRSLGRQQEANADKSQYERLTKPTGPDH